MKKSLSLDHWRDYFRTANSDIFEIIDKAITVAAFDCPKEFKLRRDRIAEKLFTCRLTRCSGCDRVDSAVPGREEKEYEDENDNRGCKSSRDDAHVDDDDDDDDGCGEDNDDHDGAGCDMGYFEVVGGSKESKVNSTSRDDNEVHGEMNVNINHQIVSNYSYGEAEALTDEIEEESQVVGEVLRIKEILHNSQDETDSVLFECLTRLQLMALSVDILKGTEIGKAVNVLRKHGSMEIRHLARTLIDGWKVLVDEWVEATKAIAGAQGGTPDSVNPSVVDEEEGLPSPPLDDLAFFAAPPTSMELSQFFDGMDDDGNPRHSGEFIKNRDSGRKPSLESGRKPSLENQNVMKRKQHAANEVNVLTKDNRNQQLRKQEGIAKPNKPLNAESGPGRLPKVAVEQRVNKESKLQQKPDKGFSQRKLSSGQVDKSKCSDEVAVQRKLEATKRKLQERYQQAENAKKQRTIQVMELRDLPKQGLVNKNPHGRPFFNRHWANGRR